MKICMKSLSVFLVLIQFMIFSCKDDSPEPDNSSSANQNQSKNYEELLMGTWKTEEPTTTLCGRAIYDFVTKDTLLVTCTNLNETYNYTYEVSDDSLIQEFDNSFYVDIIKDISDSVAVLRDLNEEETYKIIKQ